MDFSERLATLRKGRSLTQDTLAERVGVHVSQIRRYEAATSTPTLDVLRKLAIALSVSADTLAFDKDERGPRRRPPTPIRSNVTAHRRRKPRRQTVIEGILLTHEAKRWAA